MADSDALRSRRKRAHSAGDHSLCRRCDARGAVVAFPAAGDAAVDARASLEGLVRRLEAASEADPADAAVARVLKDTVLALAAMTGAGEADPLGDLRALAARVP